MTRYRRIGYNLNVMRQSACLVFKPIMVDNYAAFFNCTPVGRPSDSMMARHKAIHFSLLGSELLVCCLAHRGSTGVFLLLRISVNYSAHRDLHGWRTWSRIVPEVSVLTFHIYEKSTKQIGTSTRWSHVVAYITMPPKESKKGRGKGGC